MRAGTEINFSVEEEAGWMLHFAKTRFFGIRFTVECGFASTFTPLMTICHLSIGVSKNPILIGFLAPSKKFLKNAPVIRR